MCSIRVNGETSRSFGIQGGVRHGCVMSSWQFNSYWDGVMRDETIGDVELKCV